MNREEIVCLLSEYKDGKIPVEEVLFRIKKLPYTDLDFAKLDTHREIRTGFPEVIYCAGKTLEQIIAITERLIEEKHNVLGTRLDASMTGALKVSFPEIKLHTEARAFTLTNRSIPKNDGRIAVICAGTSDIPVAEEASVTAEFFGNTVSRVYDAGVAGIHRLFAHLDEIIMARVIVVIAGMEGALASVVGGLASCPVIAVPTSVGYGANFGGLSALLAMLNSCSAGVSVVNIDNGFGAGYIASMINKMTNP